MKPAGRSLVAICLILCMLLPLASCSPNPYTRETMPTSDPVAPAARPTGEAAAFAPTPTPYVVPDDLSLVISEVMPSNKATLAENSEFPDWVELHNTGEKSASLKGVFLCCGTDSFALGERELAPDEYLVIFCDDSGLEGHATFSISKEGETLALRTESGVILDEFELPACEADRSACRASDGSIFVTALATPGFVNGTVGFEARQDALGCDAPLQISEVMVHKQFLNSPKGTGSDWVELKNVSGGEIKLSDFYLSDSGKDRMAYRLPDQTLASGAYALIYCDGSADGGVYAPFKLNSEREQLYLSTADGALADYALLENIPYGASYGRAEGENGFFYFLSPNPGGDDSGGVRRVAEKPVLLSREGVFDDVESVEVVLSAPGEIHYTTDGSAPDENSPLYTGPLSLSSTAVVRAINIEPGCITDGPLNMSFIINEHHTLPVVSVMTDPDNIFSRSGMYNDLDNVYEVPGAIEFFEEDGSFSIACGIKLHGDVSKRVSGKRTLKICFRSRYEGQLHYDLFGNGVTDFASILVRHPAEDNMSTYLRDILVHELGEACFPALPTLDHKFCVMYIDGEYWGIYALREAYSEDHYANHYGYDPDTVDGWQRLWDRSTVVGEACQFILNNNMADEDNYSYACQYLDMDSVIAWTILQGWCANYDCNPSNVRYYYSSEDNVMRYALSDLDLGMFTYDLLDVPLYGSINGGVRNNYDFNILTRKLLANRSYQLRMAEMLSEAMHGALADENVVNMINGFRDELQPEVPRDLRRWFPALSEENAVATWNLLVDRLCDYVTAYGGRSTQIIESFIAHTSPLFTQEEIDRYFGDLLG